MNRREFVGVAATAAAPLSAAQSAKDGPSLDYKPGRAVMKLGCQRGPTSDEMLTHFARAGVEQINGYPEKGPDGIYSVDELSRLRERAQKHGIEVTMIQMLLASSYITRSEEPSIMLGKPERDKAIERCCQIIRNCAKAGIPSVKYNMTLLGVLSTERETGRGGNLQRSWDLAKAKQDPPLTEAGSCMADCMWERIEYFLKRVVPVANEYRIRLACHPHDPGVPKSGFRGVDRVLGTVDGLKKFVSIAESPYHGFNFCQGTVSEMLQDPGKEILDVIRHFGQRRKIFNVHFRNIKGKRDKFTETYPDEGDVNFVKAIKVYKEVGYPYMMMPDHMPTHPLDRGGNQAFFFAYGYIRALIQAMKEG
jgi:mannonate dehydratase